MIARLEKGIVKVYMQLPNQHNSIINFRKASIKVQQEKGFFKVLEPAKTGAQRYGELLPEHFDSVNKTWVKPIKDFTQGEIEANLKSNSEAERQELMQRVFDKKIIEEAQSEEDDDVLLENQSLYPFWEGGLDLIIGHKIQAFDNGELKLFRVVQSHLSQSDWHPTVAPALFTRVGFVDEVLEWVQPTGGHDAYNIGDKVKFNDKTYASVIDANTWSPTAYPSGWSEEN